MEHPLMQAARKGELLFYRGDPALEILDTNPYKISFVGGWAVIKMSGPVGPWWGICPESFSRTLEVVLNEGAKSILLSIDTNGGLAQGLTPFAEILANLGSRVRLAAYIPCKCYSAGMLLAAAAGSKSGLVFADPSAGMGSVGAKITRYEVKEEGVTPTVFAWGRRKAWGDPHTPMSDEEKTHWATHIKAEGEAFAAQVAAYGLGTVEFWEKAEAGDVAPASIRGVTVKTPQEMVEFLGRNMSIESLTGSGGISPEMAKLKEELEASKVELEALREFAKRSMEAEQAAKVKATKELCTKLQGRLPKLSMEGVAVDKLAENPEFMTFLTRLDAAFPSTVLDSRVTPASNPEGASMSREAFAALDMKAKMAFLSKGGKVQV